MEEIRNLVNSRIARLNEESARIEKDVRRAIRADDDVDEVARLQDDLSRRQASYLKRERAYQLTIDTLKDEIKGLKKSRSDWMGKDTRIASIRHLHKNVLENVDSIQSRTAAILKEQEADLLRAFRARLFDTQTELEKERAKTNGDENSLFNRTRQLEREVDWAKEMADRLDRANKSLTKENARLKAQFKAQGDDRDFLVKQLVTVKRDNAKLKIALENSRAETSEMKSKYDEEVKKHRFRSTTPTLPKLERMSTAPVGMEDGGLQKQSGGQSAAVMEERYKKVIKRLKRLLDAERKHLRSVRTAYANDVNTRTQLETLLREAADQVKRQIAKRRSMGILEEEDEGSIRDGSALLSSKSSGTVSP